MTGVERTCPACGRPGQAGSDFCVCGEYLRWDLTGQLPAVAVAVAPAAPPPAPAPVAAPAYPPPPGPPPAPPPPAALATVTVRLPDVDAAPGEGVALGVHPGGRAHVLAQVRNSSGIVDNYTLTVLGLPAEWYSIHPERVYLVPFGTAGAYEQDVRIDFHPPRSPEAAAGVRELRVVAHSQAHGREAATSDPFVLGIQPYEEFEPRIKPQRASGRRKVRYEVAVENRGNAPVSVALRLDDPENAVRSRFTKPVLHLQTGETATTRLEVRAPRRMWVGRPLERRLELVAEPGAEAPVVEEAGDGWVPDGVAAPRVAGPRLSGGVGVGPGGVAVNAPRVSAPRVTGPRVPSKRVDLASLKAPGQGGAPAFSGPLLPTQVIFRQKPYLPWWTPLLLLPLLLLGLALWFLLPKTVVVPDLTTSETTLEAQQKLAEAELVLNPNVESVVSAQAPPGTILGQAPKAGSEAKKGAAVAIQVAVGTGTVRVPKVVGLTVPEADRLLREAKLTLGAITPQPPDLEAKIDTQLPAADGTAKEGEAVAVFLETAKPADRARARGLAPAKETPAADATPTPTPTPEARPAGAPPADLAFDDGEDVQLLGTDGAVAALASGDAVEKDPTWAPDGERLAFVAGGLLVVRDGDRPRTVSTPEQGRLEDPAWAPTEDGDVLTVSRVRGEDRDLCFARLDAAAVELSCLPDDGTVLVESARWSPDGRTLLVPGFQTGTTDQGILRFRTDEAFSPRAEDWRADGIVTDTSRGAEGRFVQDAALSPDGRRLAVVANLDSDVPTLYITDPGDLELAEAKPLPVRACKVAWSPDGRELAVAQMDTCDRRAVAAGQLVRVRIDRPREPIVVSATGDNPAYRPASP